VGTGGLATLVDRKSRFTIIVKVQSKNADHVHEKIKRDRCNWRRSGESAVAG
jgi:IS30 family transposase